MAQDEAPGAAHEKLKAVAILNFGVACWQSGMHHEAFRKSHLQGLSKAYGVPVLFGPFMQPQPELRRLVLRQGAGIEVQSHQLAEKLLALLADSAQRAKIGQAGRQLMQENAGATLRTWNHIKENTLI